MVSRFRSWTGFYKEEHKKTAGSDCESFLQRIVAEFFYALCGIGKFKLTRYGLLSHARKGPVIDPNILFLQAN